MARYENRRIRIGSNRQVGLHLSLVTGTRDIRSNLIRRAQQLPQRIDAEENGDVVGLLYIKEKTPKPDLEAQGALCPILATYKQAYMLRLHCRRWSGLWSEPRVRSEPRA